MSSVVDDSLIENLFALISQLGLNDSIYIDNIPFNKKGEVCFIDTEHYGHWPISYRRLNGALTAKARKKWRTLYKAKD